VQLEDISVRLRERTHWEAIDLGVAMIREWWWPIYGAWLAIVVPIAALLAVGLSAWPLAALIAIWWLKPFYDRVVLHVLARAVFGAAPSVRETVGALRSIAGSSSLAWGLTFGRLSTARSFNLAVRQLEGQRGAEARERERTLGRRAGGHAANLLIVCLVFETAAYFALGGLAELVTPPSIETDLDLKALWDFLVGDAELPGWITLLAGAMYFTALTLIEPMYVASGFALYLNRRTSLEAWDLELAFRRMAQRHAASRTGAKSRIAAALLVTALCAGSVAGIAPSPARAAEPPAKAIKEVLASPDFGELRKEMRWQPRNRDEQQPERDTSDRSWMNSIVNALAELARVLAYGIMGAGVFLLVRFLLKQFGYVGRAVQEEQAPPEVLFGLDVRPESLPDDLAGVAAAVARTDPVAALSLLYRGALATLIHRDRLAVDSGDTEGDCVRRVESERPPPLGAYFRRLVAEWTAAAYGHRTPVPESIASLCQEWPVHFDRKGRTA
jgi:hypothetical protein